ncbi:MAG: J domain-containing protein, partial [Rectinema sp.]
QSYGNQSHYEEIERKAVEDAYRFLGLEPYTSFSRLKIRYKELLKKHHPDRHTGSPEDMQKATVVSAKINTAYQLIETWEESRMEHLNGK